MDNNEEHESTIGQHPPTKKTKPKEVAIFGNYRNYYGYRISQELEEDPRLKALKKEWFEGKDCLDIGCNSGLITITVAKKFGCRSILGVDIDSARIEDAYWNLRKIVRTSMHKVPPKTSKMADAEGINEVEHNVTDSSSKDASDISADFSPLQGRDLFDIVSFQKGNFVQSWYPLEDKCYDTILCLSVTKWIHLNWGDDGLITLFSKIWRLLQPGGILVLEPQSWTSYYNNRFVSEAAKNNYRNIEIYPEDFQDVLLDKIGFRMVENITSSLSGNKSGFNRPILAFWK